MTKTWQGLLHLHADQCKHNGTWSRKLLYKSNQSLSWTPLETTAPLGILLRSKTSKICSKMFSKLLLALAAFTCTTLSAPSQQQTSTVPNVYWTVKNLTRGSPSFPSPIHPPLTIHRLHPTNNPQSVLLLPIHYLCNERPTRLQLQSHRLGKPCLTTEQRPHRSSIQQLWCLSLQWW